MMRAMSGSVKQISTFYQRMVKDHLLIIQSVQAGSLMMIGDVLAQSVVDKKSLTDVDFIRTTKFGTIGLFLIGPAVGTWYKFLAARVTVGSPGVIAVKKVALDQLVFAPGFLPIFITAVNVLNCKSWDFIEEQIKLKYFSILITNYKVWPLTQLINFGLVPLQYQILVNQGIAIFWNAYLSHKTQTK